MAGQHPPVHDALPPRRLLAVFLLVAIDAAVSAAPFPPRSALRRELDDGFPLVAASTSLLLAQSSVLLLANARRRPLGAQAMAILGHPFFFRQQKPIGSLRDGVDVEPILGSL